MRIRNNNPLDLEGSDGEVITIKVTSEGTVHLVNYNLDGSEWGGGSFTLNKAAHDPSILVMFFTFSNPSGGRYEIEVTGSHGGISNYTVSQVYGEASDSITYTFDIV